MKIPVADGIVIFVLALVIAKFFLPLGFMCDL